jgi:tricorn protease-like protein
MNVDYINNI